MSDYDEDEVEEEVTADPLGVCPSYFTDPTHSTILVNPQQTSATYKHCKTLNGDWYQLHTMQTYSGERDAEGRRHGQGTAVLPNGDSYNGTYEQGLRQGSGKYTWANGCSYEGGYPFCASSLTPFWLPPSSLFPLIPKSLTVVHIKQTKRMEQGFIPAQTEKENTQVFGQII